MERLFLLLIVYTVVVPIQHYLKGLNLKINLKGLAPHPNLTKWLEKGIELAIRNNFITKDKTDVSQWSQSPPRQGDSSF